MQKAANASQFGRFDIAFEYEATAEQMKVLAEEAIANSVKSAICAAEKGKRGSIDDREKASEDDIRSRFPTEVRKVKVALVEITPHIAAAPKDPVQAAQKAMASMSAEQKAAFLAQIQAAMASV